MLEIIQLPLNYFSSKCGDIHCYNAMQFSITCNYCGLITNSFAQFCGHYKDEHFEPAEKENPTDEKSIEMSVVSDMESSDENVEFAIAKKEVHLAVQEFELINFEIDINNDLTEEDIHLSPKQAQNSIDEAEFLTEIEVEYNSLPMEKTPVKEDYTQVKTVLQPNGLKSNLRTKKNRKSKYIPKKKKQTTNRIFKCKHCEKPFNIKSNRNMHELRHNEIGDFHCHLCIKTFYTKSELTKHLSSHNDERSYVCEQCGKAFRHLWVLKKHSLTHSIQVRTLPCPKCGKLFASKDTLRSHLPVHNIIPRFACEHCDQCFTSRKSLWAHKRRYHTNA